jgi:lysophospholipase L1-like esterase
MKQLLLAIFALSLASALHAADPLAPKADGTPLRLACVGDSITQGVGAGNDMAYPTQLKALLGEGWEVGNFGVSGRTLLRNGNLPYWKAAAYTKALDFKPDVVIIMLGTNDTKPQNWKHKAEFEGDYRDLVKSFLDLPTKPCVFICRPVPVLGNGNFGINDSALQEQMPVYAKLAEELKVDVIDMFAALDGKPEMLPDRVHPNAAGAGEMAKAAAKALTGKDH